MSPQDFDTLVMSDQPSWRPSLTFLADLGDRLDAVDTELEAERHQIPTDHARNESSVLFSLAAFLTPPPIPDQPAAEPSGLLQLAPPPPIPAALDSGPLSMSTPPTRRPRRATAWAAAGLLAATLALVARPGPDATDTPERLDPAPVHKSGSDPLRAATGDPELDRATPHRPEASAADAPAEPLFALRRCFGRAGAPAGVSLRVVKRAHADVTFDVTPPGAVDPDTHACLARAAAALALTPRHAGLVVLTLDGPTP